MRFRRPLVRAALSALGLLLCLSAATTHLATHPTLALAGDPVTLTRHADLGFQTSRPVSVDTGVANPPCLFSVGGCVFHGAVAFTGTLEVSATFGEDVALTYDPADLNTPGGPLPVSVKYTPTPGGSTVSYSMSGTLTLNFDGCSNCPAALPVTGSSSPIAFTAPMGSDAPIAIPGSSSGITLNVGGTPIITANVGSTLTLSPAAPGTLPGLGGAAAVLQSSGATGSPLLPLEWDTSGSTQNVSLTAPAAPAPVGISLGPLVHWVGTSGDAEIDLHWTSQFQDIVSTIVNLATLCAIPPCIPTCAVVNCTVSDPSPVGVFSGGLGPVYSAVGLDTAIGNAVGGAPGSLVASRVAAGFVPIPLTSPPLATVPPLTPGSVDFEIPAVAISGAPAGPVLSGDSVGLSAVPSGGTGPFTYAWTRNGVPFATTQGIIDAPPLGTTSYGVTVTDSSGAVSNTASTDVRVYDFTVGASPPSLEVLTSGSNTYAITESLVPGSPTSDLPTVALSVSGLPSGATGNFSPPSGSAGGFGSTLTISTVGAPPGSSALTLTGTDARPAIGGSRSATLHLTVLTPAQAIPKVIDTINGLESGGTLNGGQANSLIVKLDHAMAGLTQTPPQQPAACNQLQAFVNEVNSLVAGGTLSSAQGDQLLGGPLGVLAIMAAIPC
jgi:hypothetical protein